MFRIVPAPKSVTSWLPIGTCVISKNSIRMPLKEESVSTGIVIGVGSITLFIVAAWTEYFQSPPSNRRLSWSCKIKVSGWLVSTVRSFFAFLLGLCVTALLVELGKISSGVLRPNFISVCQPNVTCQGEDPNKFHTDYECLGDGDPEDSRKSFPSGHAAAVAYMAFFICFYVHRRPRAFERCCYLVRPTVQLIAASLAWVTSLSRVSDYVHHMSDVTVGFVLGLSIAAWVVSLVLEDRTLAVVTTDPEVEESASGQEPHEMSLKSCNMSYATTDFKTPVKEKTTDDLEN